MSVGVDADLFELLVSHLGEDVQGDLLPLEDVPQMLQPQTGTQADRPRLDRT